MKAKRVRTQVKGMMLFLFLLLCTCSGSQNSPSTPNAATEESSDPSSNTNAPPQPINSEEVDLSRPLSDCPVPADSLQPMQPIPWSVADGPNRWGYNVREVALVRSSIQVPIEVCGVNGELSWLVNLVCPDGTQPFASPQLAHAARLGNVGPGGRCGMIIDQYQLQCTESTFDIYMDLYHCTPTESIE